MTAMTAMNGQAQMISTVDYHTAGEPFRIVVGGVRPPRGATMLDKRDDAMARLDDVRVLLTHEPRGHADMYGCFVTEPEDAGADLGLVFFHRDGFSTACGHGSIAAAVWARTTGYAAPRPDGTLVLDVPSGRVTCAVGDKGGHPSVRFVNVPSYALARDVELSTTHGRTRVDVAYGGAFYAMVDAATLGLEVTPSHLPQLVRLSAQIKAGILGRHTLTDPGDARIGGLYGVIFYDRLTAGPGLVEERNVTVFANGQVDRSPCGSGTCARLATLAARGELDTEGKFINRSIIDTVFTGRLTATTATTATTAHGHPAVVPEVQGTAYPTGHHTLLLHPGDPLPRGFFLPTSTAP
ncbi:proline racemase family protein [Streptomyces sp. NPDC048172]|uniref:proline racemase family protein n=1 Tax=Streptomyces sp. NPDC048172 TaxID=3365505 RepID=UPI003721F277